MLKHDARGGYCGSTRGRVVVARSVPEIQSAGEPKRIATSILAAFRHQEHMAQIGASGIVADDGQTARKIVAAQLVGPPDDPSGCR